MSVRAKFKCTHVSEISNEPRTITMEPVISGSKENESFYLWSPGGSITLGCVNEAANGQFVVGREYYVDFSQAE